MADDEIPAQAEPAPDAPTGAAPSVAAARNPEDTGASVTKDPLEAYNAELAAAMAPAPEGEKPSTGSDATDAAPQEGDQAAEEFPDLKDDESEGDGADESTEGEQEDEKTDEDAQEQSAATDGPKRIRLHDPVSVAIAAISKARNCDLAEAAAIYAGTPPVAAAAAEPTPKDSTPARTAVDIQREIDEAKAAKKEAAAELDMSAMVEADDKLDLLREELSASKRKEAEAATRQASAEQARLDAAFDQNWATASSLYPDLSDEKSALYKEVMAIDAKARELGDPLVDSPDKPMIFAKQAALKLGVPMTDPKAAKPAAQPQKPTPKGSATRPAPQPAGGNARTTPAAATPLDQKIASVKTMGDYEKLTKELGLAGGLFTS